MRIMVTECEDLGSKEVKEIVDIGYDNDIFDDGGTLYGLYFVDADGYYFYIPEIDVGACNSICLALCHKGFVDLTHLGEYLSFENF